MIAVLCMCAVFGALLSVPLIRHTRRMEAARLIVRRGDYLRTRGTRLQRVGANSFGVRL